MYPHIYIYKIKIPKSTITFYHLKLLNISGLKHRLIEGRKNGRTNFFISRSPSQGEVALGALALGIPSSS